MFLTSIIYAFPRRGHVKAKVAALSDAMASSPNKQYRSISVSWKLKHARNFRERPVRQVRGAAHIWRFSDFAVQTRTSSSIPFCSPTGGGPPTPEGGERASHSVRFPPNRVTGGGVLFLETLYAFRFRWVRLWCHIRFRCPTRLRTCRQSRRRVAGVRKNQSGHFPISILKTEAHQRYPMAGPITAQTECFATGKSSQTWNLGVHGPRLPSKK